MKHTAALTIDKKELDLYNKLLEIEANETDTAVIDSGYPEDSTIYTLTAYFDNGYFADLKLCSGQSNFFGDSILFSEDGCELCVLDCFDSLDKGDVFIFEDGDDTYEVIVS